MSNYNSQLQSNNIDLQTVLQTLQTKAAGTQLPELTNEGVAADLLANKELIDSNGNKITGSMPNNGSINFTMDGINTKSVSVPAGYTSGGTVSLDNTIDNEVNTQANLIAQIVSALEGKAAGGGSGDSQEACTVYFINGGLWMYVSYITPDSETGFLRNSEGIGDFSIIVKKDSAINIISGDSKFGDSCTGATSVFSDESSDHYGTYLDIYKITDNATIVWT